jgi:hypothetical protein
MIAPTQIYLGICQEFRYLSEDPLLRSGIYLAYPSDTYLDMYLMPNTAVNPAITPPFEQSRHSIGYKFKHRIFIEIYLPGRSALLEDFVY